jgi:hypothetical protein
VPAGAGRIERGEDLLEELALEEAHRLGGERIALLPLVEPLLGGHPRHHLLDLGLEAGKVVELPFGSVTAEGVEIDEPDAGVLLRVGELGEEPVDLFELLLDRWGRNSVSKQ